MGIRISSLSELGGGSWRVSGEINATKNPTMDVQPKKTKKWSQLPGAMSPPQASLLALVMMAWPTICQSEFKGAVPGRRFTLDIAFEHYKVGCEVDGWSFHGQHKAGFHRDREKDKLLMLNGWKTIRFTAKEISSDGIGCLKIIEKILGIPSAIPLA